MFLSLDEPPLALVLGKSYEGGVGAIPEIGTSIGPWKNQEI